MYQGVLSDALSREEGGQLNEIHRSALSGRPAGKTFQLKNWLLFRWVDKKTCLKHPATLVCMWIKKTHALGGGKPLPLDKNTYIRMSRKTDSPP